MSDQLHDALMISLRPACQPPKRCPRTSVPVQREQPQRAGPGRSSMVSNATSGHDASPARTADRAAPRQPAPKVDQRSTACAGPAWVQVGCSMRAVSDRMSARRPVRSGTCVARPEATGKAAPNRPGTGSGKCFLDNDDWLDLRALHLGESAVQVLAEKLRRLPWNARRDCFERRVRARQQIGDLSHLDVTPMRHRRGANVVRSSSEKSCGSSQAAKWPPRSTSLK